MSCFGMLEYLTGLHAGRVGRGVGSAQLNEYALKYLPQPAYNDDVMYVLFEPFRHPVAHRGIASGVWVDQRPQTQGRRLTWKLFAGSHMRAVTIEASAGVLTRDPPWKCRYTHRVHIHIGRLWRDIRDSANKYRADLESDQGLLDNFFQCMQRMYPQ
jgi:hypothetical protein